MGEELQKVHTSLSSQQDVVHRLEQDKRSLEAELSQLKASLQTAQIESRTLQVCSEG